MNFKVCISCFDTLDYEYSVKGLISALSLKNIAEECNISINLYTNKHDFSTKVLNETDEKLRIVFYEPEGHTPKYHKINNFHNMILENTNEMFDYFMFIDADTLVVENIFDVIRANYSNQNYELLIAHELNTKVGIDQIINYNSGLLLVRPTLSVFNTIKDWLKEYEIETQLSTNPLKVHDQPFLRKAIYSNNPVIGTLPKNCNFRGHEAQGFIDWLWDDIYVLHNHEIYRSLDFNALWKNLDAVDYNKINDLTLNLIGKIKSINGSLKPNSCTLVSLAGNLRRKIYFWTKTILSHFI